MSLFDHPDSYVCGYAGVPVSDLILRMGYLGQDYRDLYEADYHIGEDVESNMAEYKRRSPVWNVDKLTRPVRIHTNPHDEDVNFIEVEHLMQALTAAGKDFEYEVYDVPGGHSFDRLDTPEAWAARKEIYAFLARYLKPPNPKIEPRADPGGPGRAVAPRASHRRNAASAKTPRRRDIAHEAIAVSPQRHGDTEASHTETSHHRAVEDAKNSRMGPEATESAPVSASATDISLRVRANGGVPRACRP